MTRFISGIVKGDVPLGDVKSWLKAVHHSGMSPDETFHLTMAMAKSGKSLDLSSIHGPTVDKHSTGGVGDKVTLVLGPLVASVGIAFPKLAGRGLGHTGGTIDKLESIPGLRVKLRPRQFVEQVRAIGLAISEQSHDLVPADAILYSLRNKTNTVDSAPLIASSVMSKKIAAGAKMILLDVKCGRGAFMRRYQEAEELAHLMVEIGGRAGRTTRAVITSMDMPLGNAVGNAVEVEEAISTMHGNGPHDLEEHVLALGVQILDMAGIESNPQTAHERLRMKLNDGGALQKLAEMIQAQGGDPRVTEDPDRLPRPASIVEVTSRSEGYVRDVDAHEIGLISRELRLSSEGASDRDVGRASAGIVLKAKPGNDEGFIEKDSVLAELHLPSAEYSAERKARLVDRTRKAHTLGDEPVGKLTRILSIAD